MEEHITVLNYEILVYMVEDVITIKLNYQNTNNQEQAITCLHIKKILLILILEKCCVDLKYIFFNIINIINYKIIYKINSFYF